MTRATRLGLLALAGVVIGIAAFDVRARSGTADQGPPAAQTSSAPDAPPTPEIQRGLDKTPLVYPAQFVDQLVQGRRAAFVTARAGERRELVPGVLIGPREALVASASDATSWTVTTAGGATYQAAVRAVDPVHGLALLSLPTDAPTTLSFGPPALTSGSPVVAVRPTEAALVTQLIPAPGTEASLAARLTGSQLAPGTAVIDLDGRLVAFFGAGVTGGVPLVANDLEPGILPALRNGQPPAIPWLGADLQAIDAPLAAHVGEGLAVVTWVEPGSPAALAGLEARDVIVGARAGQRPIATLDALTAAMRPGLALSLDVRRGSRPRAIPITIGRRSYPRGVSASTGVAIQGGDAPVLRVAPASPLAHAGLRTGDVVEAVQGRAVTADALERTLQRARGVVLTVRRDGTRHFVVLPGGPHPPRSGS